MKWSIIENDVSVKDSSGVEGLIERMERELRGGGTPIEGFRFLNDSEEMLSFSREIEKEVRDSPSGADLYAGFQKAEKLRDESNRYRRLVQAGVKLVAFGQCPMPDPPEGLEGTWTPLERNTRALENQWFLVSSHPSPIAFAGWGNLTGDSVRDRRDLGPGQAVQGFRDQRLPSGTCHHFPLGGCSREGR